MGANDVLALEANFTSWRDKRFPVIPKELNVFEYYCAEQFLRSFDLSDSQIKSGLLGGPKDGGVDGMYMFVNGELTDAESELDPKTPNVVRLLILQVKEGEGFSPVAVDKLYWFTDDLLDLNRKKKDYHSGYRQELITAMLLFKDKYRIIVGENPPFLVEFLYITKKDVAPNDDCKTSVEKVKEAVRRHFSQAHCDFNFVNAATLWAQVQTRPPKKKALKWSSQSLSTPEGQIGLVRLADYYDFLREANGQIAERFFDSNVRGYWKSTPVNKRIADSLKNPQVEFWLLNNGVTILAEKIETGEHLEVEVTDPQIVNGLQTSREIYNYYREAKSLPPNDNRRLQVRLIKTVEPKARDSIIQATNSQNVMPDEALRATDPIHRQIETLFHRFNLFYDRRKGHYRDQGKPVSQIVGLVEVVQAMVSIVLRRPDDERARPRDYFKKNDLYKSVFGKDAFDLNLYLRSTQILTRVEGYLESLNLEAIHRRNINFYICMYAACAIAGSAFATPAQLLTIDPPAITDDFLADCYARVRKHYDRLAKKTAVNGEIDYDAIAKGTLWLKTINSDLQKRFNAPKKKSAMKATK